MSLIESALDLRTFLDELRRRGDLIDVNCEVETRLELAAITRRVYEQRLSAPLFNHLKEGLPGARVLGAPAGMLRDPAKEYARLALHFGLPEHTRPAELIMTIRAAMMATPVPPVRVAKGAVQENNGVVTILILRDCQCPCCTKRTGGAISVLTAFMLCSHPMAAGTAGALDD
ncbi:hypothetical protein [Yokenella regensburgei]|uniref:hypothetical protein n=1 Tax=Yokenella regensburgei TaxID=158877 RepID=UPI00307DD362|nr:UbiD family decarboxylase [Yokenella regensburgei]